MRVLDWGKKGRFDAVAFAPGGQLLAANGFNQPTVVWDAIGGAERYQFEEPAGHPQFHPLNGRLLLATQAGLRAFDPTTGHSTVITPTERYFGAPCFDPSGTWALLGHRSQEQVPSLMAAVRFGEPTQSTLWNVSLGDTADESGFSTSLACLPDGERFVSDEWVSEQDFRNPRRRLAVRSRADGRLLQSLLFEESSYGSQVFGSPWSNAIVIKERSGFWIVRGDDLNGPPERVQNDGRKHFTGIAFHPSGRYLAATSNDKTVKLYDTATWEIARAFTWNIGKMRSIAFSPDGALAAAGSDSGKVIVWDVDL